MLKKNRGQAYIFVLMILSIGVLVLNLIGKNIDLESELKREQNNNLYYMARYFSDYFLCVINEIAVRSFKLNDEKKVLDRNIFDEEINKCFSDKEIKLDINDKLGKKNLKYTTQIKFNIEGDLLYKIIVSTKNDYNNKVVLERVIWYNFDAGEFLIKQEEIK